MPVAAFNERQQGTAIADFGVQTGQSMIGERQAPGIQGDARDTLTAAHASSRTMKSRRNGRIG